MTEKEIITCIRLLKAHYPYYYKGITNDEKMDVIRTWTIHFKNIDYELVEKAIIEWGSKSPAPPSIAELRCGISGLYTDLDRKYSRLLKENANAEEIEKVREQREQAWSCMGYYRK